MRSRRGPYNRALGIDPTSRGFGFAVLEQNGNLVDWGTRQTPSHNRNARCIAAVLTLIRKYEPDVLALEDCSADGSRRCSRVQALIRTLRRRATEHTLSVRLVGPRELREPCSDKQRATKHEIAQMLAARFSALARQLPPRRKPWMSEDPRMGIFDAVALAVVAIEAGGGDARVPGNREGP